MKRIRAEGIRSLGRGNGERPISISVHLSEGPAVVVGRDATIHLTAREARWVGLTVLGYALTDEREETDGLLAYTATDVYERAVRAHLDKAVEEAKAAGEAEVEAWRQRTAHLVR